MHEAHAHEVHAYAVHGYATHAHFRQLEAFYQISSILQPEYAKPLDAVHDVQAMRRVYPCMQSSTICLHVMCTTIIDVFSN
jgi:hypothetical protein